MIVRLTRRQFSLIRDAIDKTWLGEWVYEEGAIAADGSKLEVLLLPDAWLEIGSYILPRYFVTGGRRASPALFDGVRKILQATNRRQMHPAFHQQKVVGRDLTILPAWWLQDRTNGRILISPWIPSDDEMDGWEPIDCWPEHWNQGGELVTGWGGRPMQRGGACGRDAYTRFISARAAALGSPIT